MQRNLSSATPPLAHGAPPSPASEQQPPPQAPVAGFSLLPSELLVEIFSLLPWRACLRVLSLVSRRWRHCARRAVTDVGLRYPVEAVQRVLNAQLPALTALLVNQPIDEAQLPLTLRELHLTGDQFGANDAAHYLPRLTSLLFG